MGKEEGTKRGIGLKSFNGCSRIGKRAIFDGEPLERCTRGSAEATPNTPKNLVPRGGLPESVQIPLDLGRLRNIMAKERRTRFSAEAIRAPGCTALLDEGLERRLGASR